MNILKLLLLLLPTSVRGAIYALCGAIATPWQRIMTDYLAWQNAARLDATTTWQVISLQHLLNERLLGAGQVGITIEDAPEGALYDFEINIPANVVYNPMLLTGLVHKYKLYGKRFNMGDNVYTYSSEWSEYVVEQALRTYGVQWSEYALEQAVRTYDVQWSGYVIEHALRTYNFEWSGYVVEQTMRYNDIRVNVVVAVEESEGIQGVIFYSFKSTYPIASDNFIVTYTYNGAGSYTKQIPLGATTSEDVQSDTATIIITGLSIESDAEYNYRIINKN